MVKPCRIAPLSSSRSYFLGVSFGAALADDDDDADAGVDGVVADGVVASRGSSSFSASQICLARLSSSSWALAMAASVCAMALSVPSSSLVSSCWMDDAAEVEATDEVPVDDFLRVLLLAEDDAVDARLRVDFVLDESELPPRFPTSFARFNPTGLLG